MTPLLYLPDDATVIQLEVELTPAELSAAVNAGMRPVAALKAAPPGKLTAIQAGSMVIVTPGEMKSSSVEKAVLSKREAQVLELSTRGLTIGEIALLLHLSRRTVNYHFSNVKERLRTGSIPVN